MAKIFGSIVVNATSTDEDRNVARGTGTVADTVGWRKVWWLRINKTGIKMNWKFDRKATRKPLAMTNTVSCGQRTSKMSRRVC